jgi:hypothetical protein
MVWPNSQGAGIETRAAHESKLLNVVPWSRIMDVKANRDVRCIGPINWNSLEPGAVHSRTSIRLSHYQM